MLVDSHCHLDRLDLTVYAGSLALALEAARAQGVTYFLCVGIDSQNSPIMVELAEKYADVGASIGVHPTEQENIEPSVADLVNLAKHPKVIAIGETGLDYYHSKSGIAWQQTRFRHHIRAAKEVQKPLIIHSRSAPEDTIRLLKEENAAEVGGVLHCFTESWEMAQQAMALNFYISFSGIVTFRNAAQLQAVAKQVPLERMLIETDAPYLAPVPYRGKPNEPAYVYYVAEAIAKLREVSFAAIASATTANFFNLFKYADRSVYDKEVMV